MGNEKSHIEVALRKDNFPGTLKKLNDYCDTEKKQCKKDETECTKEYTECKTKVAMLKAYID